MKLNGNARGGTKLPAVTQLATTSADQLARGDAKEPRLGGVSLIDPERIARNKLTRFNPIRGLNPATLTRRLDDWDAGYLREFALTADKIARRDYILQTVIPKRKGAVSRKKWTIQIVEGEDDNPDAMAQKEALTYFYNNLKATSAKEQNLIGGTQTFIRQLMDAVGMRYAAHEILWKQSPNGVTAVMNHVPLEFFENRTGKLRFLQNDYDLDGIPLEEGSWLVGVHDGVMEACSVCYLYKTMPLRDWVSYSEKHGLMPFVGRTDAAPNSEQYIALEQAVAKMSSEFSAVVNGQDTIEKIDFTQSGQLPFPPLVELMDKALSAIWRGGDLSTLSAGQGQGQGASLQGDESDVLEDDDCQWVSEVLQLQLDPLVLRIAFGNDVVPLAYFSLGGAKQIDVEREIKVDEFLLKAGAPMAVGETLERYGRTKPEEGEPLLSQPQQPPGMPGAEGEPLPGEEGAAPAGDRPPHEDDDWSMAFADELANEGTVKGFLTVALKNIAKAQAAELEPIRRRIKAIMEIPNEDDFRRELAALRNELPTMLLRVNRKPKAARAFEAAIATSMFNGIANAQAGRKVTQ